MACLPPGCPPDCPPGCPPNCPPYYTNDPQSCDALCGNGVPFTWTVPAGIVVAPTKAQANYQALQLACLRANQGKICFITTSLPDGMVGKPYSQNIQVRGGVPWVFPFLPPGCAQGTVIPYDFEVDIFGAGPLPDGLIIGCQSISDTNPGLIRGTPTLVGTYNFTIIATDAVGAFQKQTFTIHISGTNYGNRTPPINSGVGASWGTLPAGTYRVSYVNGAMHYGLNALWLLNLDNGFAQAGFHVRHSGGATTDFPGTTGTYGSQALVEAANAGKSVVIHHTGGDISIYLQDSDYADNSGGAPSPTFNLSA